MTADQCERPDEPSAIEALYARIAPVYDVVYGLALEHGRRRAMDRLAPKPGERILEVGVGTGLSAVQYPAGCRVVAIDLSAQMIARARSRLVKRAVGHVVLCRMDAAQLGFADGSFHAVYAPYLINVVPDAAAVAREMLRVCRPGGRLVFLNHFDGARGQKPSRAIGRLVGRLASRLSGANWYLDLAGFLTDTGLIPVSIESVNVPPVSSVLVCRK